MIIWDSYIPVILVLQLNFLFITVSILTCGFISYACNNTSLRSFFKKNKVDSFIKYTLLLILLLSLVVILGAVWNYYNYNIFIINSLYSSTGDLGLYGVDLLYNDGSLLHFGFLNTSYFNFSVDFFGLVLLCLSYVVGFISLLALDTRLYWKNFRYIFTFNVFVLIVYLYVTTNNILLFFLYYEFLLLPSFLFIYFVSPSRRAVQASIYFVVWTQLGSFLVLSAVSFIVYSVGSSDFDLIRRHSFTFNEATVIYTLLFFGFGFKVPIWPFHYWLTKTHVEAPSGFSIYLSGFLVKSALYGFYKISTLLNVEINTTIFILITLLGVFDSSLKMWGQTDIKKLVAYGTIQEMNLIFLIFCWGDSLIMTAGIIFTITHAFLSSLMFYLVDCVYRRFHTRSIVEINGILHITPNLGVGILLMTIFFSGLPGTIKFVSEFYIFSGFIEISPLSCAILMFTANVVGLIGFSKVWFNLVFGGYTKNTKYLPMDLSYKEGLIILINFCILFFFCFLPSSVF